MLYISFLRFIQFSKNDILNVNIFYREILSPLDQFEIRDLLNLDIAILR